MAEIFPAPPPIAVKAEVSGGVTTGAFVNQFTHTNDDFGLSGMGTIGNTGGNDLEVKETATDFFGTTDSVTTTVPAGGSLLLSEDQNIGAARPPYKSYSVAVRHPGAATTFNIECTSFGAQ